MEQRKGLFQQQRYNKAKDELNRIESRIKGLKQEQTELEEKKKNDLRPEELRSAIGANILTIFLSVVVPMVIYFFIVSDITILTSAWGQKFRYSTGLLSWIIGLSVVFDWIYARINDESAKGQRLYRYILDNIG